MVRAAHKWTRFHVSEAHLLALCFKGCKLLERYVTLNGKMLERWAKVLPNGEYIDLVRAHIMHDFDNLIPCLAQSQHEAGLGCTGRTHYFLRGGP